MLGAEDLRIVYAASDLFVSASTCETLGNTVVEASAASSKHGRLLLKTLAGLECGYSGGNPARRWASRVRQGKQQKRKGNFTRG